MGTLIIKSRDFLKVNIIVGTWIYGF